MRVPKNLRRELRIARLKIDKVVEEYGQYGAFLNSSEIAALGFFLGLDREESPPSNYLWIMARRSCGLNKRSWFYITAQQYKRLKYVRSTK